MKSDVIIIGGGVSGLATGALLARQGYRATVLEKGNQPGGRAYTYIDRGFTLNYGAHAVYRPETGLLAQILKKLDKPAIPCGYPDPIRSFWADGDRFGSLGAKPHQILRTKLFPFRTRLRLMPLTIALRTANPENIPAGLHWSDWVDAHTSDPLLRRFIMAMTALNTYSRAPADLSASGMVKQLKENMFARDYAGYMSGGWSSMYDTFIDALREHGGELVTGARVDSIELHGGRAVAALVGGERYQAEAFVCTLPPQDAPSIAPAGSPLAAELARWSTMTDVRACCIDLGFSRRLRTDTSFIFDIERQLYYSLHSEVMPDLAPAGGQLLHAMAYLSPEEAASDAGVQQRKTELLAGLDRFFNGWRDAAVVERTLPNVRVLSARRTPDQYGENAMPLRSTAASNLYFANDARDLPYHLTLTCFAAALEVADVIGREHKPAPRQEGMPMRSPVIV